MLLPVDSASSTNTRREISLDSAQSPSAWAHPWMLCGLGQPSLRLRGPTPGGCKLWVWCRVPKLRVFTGLLLPGTFPPTASGPASADFGKSDQVSVDPRGSLTLAPDEEKLESTRHCAQLRGKSVQRQGLSAHRGGTLPREAALGPVWPRISECLSQVRSLD